MNARVWNKAHGPIREPYLNTAQETTMKVTQIFFFGMASQALITASLLALDAIKVSVGQQVTAAIMFVILGFIYGKLK